MKKNFIIGLTAFALVSCSETIETETIMDASVQPQTNGYTINADFTDVDISKAYLSQYVKGEWVHKDSIDVVDGKFTFTGELELPEVWYLRFDDKKEYIPVFVENSEIAISGKSLNKKEVKIEGSSIQDNLKSFNESNEVFYKEMDELYEKYMAAEEAGDTALLSQIDVDYESVSDKQGDFVKGFISKNNENVIAPYLTLSHLLNGMSINEIDSVLSTFSSDLDESKYIVSIQERYEKLKTTEIETAAPLFSQNDVDGNAISLESFKGKYVLLDFWASWCGPCRKENPNVVAAYDKYHEAGFEILGISLDDNKDKWLEAIEKDGLSWSHVSDLKGWANEVAQQYGVNSIPHSILLDQDGVIIAKNLRGEELHSKLEEIFKAL